MSAHFASRVIVFALILNSISSTNSNNYNLNSRLIPSFDGTSIWNQKFRSTLACIAYCERDHVCVSVASNRNTMECIGYKICPPSTLNSAGRTEWKRYCKEPPIDCEAYQQNEASSGVYTVYPASPNFSPSIQVYCDMDTLGGGFTVFQHRFDGSVNFYKGWNDYKNGFGSLSGEFWLGNDNIHMLSQYHTQRLHIVMQDLSDVTRTAIYDNFALNDESTEYTISVGTYGGNETVDAFTKGPNWIVDGMKFSTLDRDNDLRSSASCAQSFTGAWWYNDCMASNLNGQYSNICPGGTKCNYWTGRGAMKMTKMMMKRM